MVSLSQNELINLYMKSEVITNWWVYLMISFILPCNPGLILGLGTANERRPYLESLPTPLLRFNTRDPWQNYWHFVNDNLKCIFLNEIIRILNSCFSKRIINDKSALVQEMVWCWTGSPDSKAPRSTSITQQTNSFIWNRYPIDIKSLLSGNKPLPEIKLTKIYDTISRQMGIVN